MRVSINAIDDRISIDGESGTVSCNDLRIKQISAVQWVEGKGEIEYIGHVKPNESFDDFAEFQAYIDHAEFPEALPEIEPPPAPPEPKPPISMTKLAPIEQIAFEHEVRLSRLEGRMPMTEEDFQDNLHKLIDAYLTEAGVK